MPKILIITFYWPPLNTIATHRPYAWARHWSEAGAEVTVLTAKKRSIDTPLDLSLPALNNVCIIEVPYGESGMARADFLMRNPMIRRYLRKTRVFIERNSSARLDRRSSWFDAAKPYVADLAAKSDYVVSTFGPETSHLLANAAKIANPDIFWVADYRDLWSQHPRPEASKASLTNMRRREENSVGKNADLVTAVSEDMLRKIGEFYDGGKFLSPNGFDMHDNELGDIISAPFRRSSPPIRIVYTGTVYRGHQDPTPLLEVLATMMEKREVKSGDVFLDFYGSAVESIRELQRNPRFKPFLRFFGHVPREVAMKAQQDADLLLLLESPDPASRGVLTGKVFEYITAGRPIICVGSHPEYEIGSLLQRTGTGKVLERADSEQMASIIEKRLQGAGRPAWFAPGRLEEPPDFGGPPISACGHLDLPAFSGIGSPAMRLRTAERAAGASVLIHWD